MITVENSPSMLAWQLAQIATKIRNEFYQRERLYVLPYLPQKSRERAIHFPRVAGFAEQLRVVNDFEHFPDLTVSIRQSLENFASIDSKKYAVQLQKYKHALEQIMSSIEIKLKLVFSISNSITIIPTFYGSIGSYDLWNSNIYLFPRIDLAPEKVLFLIINALVHLYEFQGIDLHVNHSLWREKQERVKELITLHNLKVESVSYVEFSACINNKTIGNLAHESAKYLKELGYPINSYITSAEQIPNLSKSEFLVLSEFLDHRTLVVSFGRIAELLWGNESGTKYSLYAISKAIQRIRDKISSSGVHQNLIHCDRRKGYVLYD